ERAHAVDHLRLVVADEAGGHDREPERVRIATRLLAGADETLATLTELVVRGAERVDLVRVARGDRGETRAHGAPENEPRRRRVRRLHGSRERGLVFEAVRAARVVEAGLRPRAHDDLDLLLEEVEALARVEEREAVGEVLALEPAGAHADVEPSAGDVVDRHR